MELIYTIDWMKQTARRATAEGRVVGLVPTMARLHEGHLSLVRAARAESSPVVVSIFPNPKPADGRHETGTLDADAARLEPMGVDYLFAPPAEEMCPLGFSTYATVEGLSDRLEGRSRPAHFRRVTTLMLKLFEIVRPTLAYLGRKNAQQARIVRQMARDLNLEVRIVVCPIVRETDGLALSSRNRYLERGDRVAATALHRALVAVRERGDRVAATVLHRALVAVRERIDRGERLAAPLVNQMHRVLSSESRAAVDYAEIVDADTFESIGRLRGSCIVILAAFIGSTRLIDNMIIETVDGDVVCTL